MRTLFIAFFIIANFMRDGFQPSMNLKHEHPSFPFFSFDALSFKLIKKKYKKK